MTKTNAVMNVFWESKLLVVVSRQRGCQIFIYVRLNTNVWQADWKCTMMVANPSNEEVTIDNKRNKCRFIDTWYHWRNLLEPLYWPKKTKKKRPKMADWQFLFFCRCHITKYLQTVILLQWLKFEINLRGVTYYLFNVYILHRLCFINKYIGKIIWKVTPAISNDYRIIILETKMVGCNLIVYYRERQCKETNDKTLDVSRNKKESFIYNINNCSLCEAADFQGQMTTYSFPGHSIFTDKNHSHATERHTDHLHLFGASIVSTDNETLGTNILQLKLTQLQKLDI